MEITDKLEAMKNNTCKSTSNRFKKNTRRYSTPK